MFWDLQVYPCISITSTYRHKHIWQTVWATSRWVKLAILVTGCIIYVHLHDIVLEILGSECVHARFIASARKSGWAL